MTPENKKRAGAEDIGYAAWMAETVEPYLKEHGKKGYLKMEDGMSIAYRCYSLPDAGKCVVISHGFCEFAEKYNEVVYRFLQEGYSVYVPEHRGHGYSGREVDDPELVHVQSYDSYVTDFARFVETVVSPREEHRMVFAHSMGGAIAILALERYPEMFEAAILSAPMCGMQTGKYPRIVARLLAGSCCLLGKRKTLPVWRDSGDFLIYRNLREAAAPQKSAMTICLKSGFWMNITVPMAEATAGFLRDFAPAGN